MLPNQTQSLDTAVAVQDVIEASQRAVSEQRILPDDVAPGQGCRQGDLYVWRLAGPPDDLPANRVEGEESRQLAAGTTTGSRHVVGDHVHVYHPVEMGVAVRIGQFPNGTIAIRGPILYAEERFLISHPEHADHSLPAGWYQVTHQADLSTGAAVLD